jgi:hypothetical protein
MNERKEKPLLLSVGVHVLSASQVLNANRRSVEAK